MRIEFEARHRQRSGGFNRDGRQWYRTASRKHGGNGSSRVILYTAMTQNNDPHLLNEINAKTQLIKSNASPQPSEIRDLFIVRRRSKAATPNESTD